MATCRFQKSMAFIRTIGKNFYLSIRTFSIDSTCFNSNRASITKIRRKTYVKMYPTVLVNPDGSTINIRYHEPRMIIKLPPNLEEMTEEEKQKYLKKQIPKEEIVIEEEIHDTFDINQYSHLWKKK